MNQISDICNACKLAANYKKDARPKAYSSATGVNSKAEKDQCYGFWPEKPRPRPRLTTL